MRGSEAKLLIAAVVWLSLMGAPGRSETKMPARIAECVVTQVKEVSTRLEGTPGSGSLIVFSNGDSQVSYDTVPSIEASRPGDRVIACLVFKPVDCPPGDVRGKIYTSTNLRTGGIWRLPDSEHSCGGA